MSEIVRQLATAERNAGVSITSLTPSAPAAVTGAQAIPIALAVQGHYFGIANFVHLLRAQAGLSKNTVHASGRLYAVDSISLGSATGSGVISATVNIDAFASGSAPAPPPAS
jgi:hypothetical protein